MGQGFSKDGSATKVIEGIPVIGYFASIGHAANGHDDHAKRAAAKCTNSTLATAGGIVGSFAGQPALGAMAGAAIGSAIGIGSEHGVSKHIQSQEVKGDVGNVAPSRFITEVALGAVTGGTAGAGSKIATDIAKEAGIQGLKATATRFVAGQAVGKAFGSTVHTVADVRALK